MINYITFVWNEGNSLAVRAAEKAIEAAEAKFPSWQYFRAPGLFVLYKHKTSSRDHVRYLLDASRGIILGRLFHRRDDLSSLEVPETIDGKTTHRVIETGVRSVIDDFWGEYVAFISDASSSRAWVLRDPTGKVPCYRARFEEVDTFFAHIEDIRCLGLWRFTIDERIILSHLVFAKGSGGRLTGLKEVTVLLAGECAQYKHGTSSTEFYWNPLRISIDNPIEDASEAELMLHKTTRTCVLAWASCFDSILLGISGGIDSSIVLSCLRDAPRNISITCDTVYSTSGSSDDERQFARTAAGALGRRLVETRLNTDWCFEPPENCPRAAEPYFFSAVSKRRIEEAERSVGREFDALFSGFGGDELFFDRGLNPTVADYLFSHGLRRAALRIALDDSYIDGASLWEIAKRAVPYGLMRRSWNIRDEAVRRVRRSLALHDLLVSEDIYASAFAAKEIFHPLFIEPMRSVPPGKVYHSFLRSVAANHRYRPRTAPEERLPVEVDPLQSQPLMELTLRIPLYVLRAGGRDRGLARRAFSDELPKEIVLRRSKGTGEDALQASVIRKVGMLRELLLDGYLVRQGYLSRSKLREVLEPTMPTKFKSTASVLLNCLVVEWWVRTWVDGNRAWAELG